MSNPYGRPFRRRKAAALWGQPLCSICGKPIQWPGDGTLHHTVPVCDGGNAFHERPAHKTCNASHGGKLGAERSGRKRRSRGGERPKCWPGAIDYEAAEQDHPAYAPQRVPAWILRARFDLSDESPARFP